MSTQSTFPVGSWIHPAAGTASALPPAPNTTNQCPELAPTHPPKPSTAQPSLRQHYPQGGVGTPRGAVTCRRGQAEGRGYSHMPPMTPAILQSHLYHQVMPSSAEAVAASGAAAAGNCSSCELILPLLPGSAPCCPPEPPGVTPSSGQPRGRPLKPGLAVSPCPHAGLAPPGLTMEGGVAAERCQQGLELLHCWLELHCGSPPAAGRALPLMSLALKGCGQSSAARTHQRRHSRAPRDSSGCPRE